MQGLRMLDFGQFRLRPIRLRPAGRNRIGRSRNWPKSNRWCLLCFFLFCFFSFFFSFFSSFIFVFSFSFSFSSSSFSSYSSFSFCSVSVFVPRNLCPEPQTQNPHPSAGPALRSTLFFPNPATVFILFSLSCWSFR